MNYKSPIEMYTETSQLYADNEVFKAINNIGIEISKEELIKALHYDREQYEKGWTDAVEAITNDLSECMMCAICKNPMHNDRGCDGNCNYDRELYMSIMKHIKECIKWM